MRPLTSVLLAVLGALLVVSWVLASGSPAAPPGPAVPVEPPAPPPPELAVIDREVDRLSERLAVAEHLQAPVRDPFQFEAAAGSDAIDPDDPIASESFVRVPQVAWPRLVAILTSGDPAAPVRAVIEDGRAMVQIRTAGETVGEITIVEVAAGSVLLRHSSGVSRRVTLD